MYTYIYLHILYEINATIKRSIDRSLTSMIDHMDMITPMFIYLFFNEWDPQKIAVIAAHQCCDYEKVYVRRKKHRSPIII